MRDLFYLSRSLKAPTAIQPSSKKPIGLKNYTTENSIH